jgi:hypothetical protein
MSAVNGFIEDGLLLADEFTLETIWGRHGPVGNNTYIIRVDTNIAVDNSGI